MASYGHHMPAAAPRAAHPATYGAPMPAPVPTAPAGTFAPGTKIQVGNHRVVIQKYLSEGGFAHVYLVKLPKPIDGTDMAVLKRVAVPDKEALRSMRTEVETMKRLKGHRPIVTYIDSHASEMRGGGYEVFLLMEFCDGGGLIDFMNTRLQHRLTEPEILHIFTDIAEGVACMHYLKPPLLHRDLKVENVLIVSHGSQKKFKVCDFGSAAPPKPAPQTVVECRLMDEDVQKHTTMQYRSPEMIDVYRKLPIDEKSDIWALGVLLYKLCYYTTPFEDQGQLAILNASYRFPSYPVFSDRLKKLIASMLRESPAARPNIYQVLREGCAMQGRDVPIHDIYTGKQRSEPQSRPAATEPAGAKPVVGAVFAPAKQEEQVLPDIVPMRRGRLPASSQQPQAQAQQAAKPSPSPMRVTNGDPFAALDTPAAATAAAAATTPAADVDEFSSRFPSLDQFSLLHESGSKFNFDSHTPPATQQQRSQPQRPAEKPVDAAFPAAHSPPKNKEPVRPRTVAPTGASSYTPPTVKSPPPGAVGLTKTASAPTQQAEMSRAHAIINKNPELQAISSHSQAHAHAQNPYQAPPSRYVSTGTMTNTPPPEQQQAREPAPIWRVPTTDPSRSTSLPRQSESSLPSRSAADDPVPGSIPRVPSYQFRPNHVRHPSSSRPSLEGGRPSLDLLDSSAQRRSIDGRQRPVSTHLESNLDFLREKEGSSKPLPSPGLMSPKFPDRVPSPAAPTEPEQEEAHIESNVEFLRSMEESKSERKEWGAKHGKRGSLSSLSGTKNILAGKFGDAFKRFEGNQAPAPARTPSPLKQLDRPTLTPIEGSEATDGRTDDGKGMEETEDMTPAMRRELERLRLEEEERRVEAAAAEYRQRFTNQSSGPGGLPKSIGGVSRAVSIQNRVQNLLNEGQKSSAQVPRTAQGYGVYTDNSPAPNRLDKQLPEIPRKPVGGAKSRSVTPSNAQDVAVHKVRPSASDPVSQQTGRSTPGPRPVAPRKPMHLNSLPTGGRSGSPPKSLQAPSMSSDHLVGVGLPGRPVIEMSAREKEDYLQDFSKRFPSLGSIEMVERDLAAEAGEQRPAR
ncbi:Serine/threonine-protein kinase ppk30 [Colletotrichum siamense]|uniref:non-specific serine/threonine protein kinase n=1 Tax=Colletotrichum siamense TaxID=690259 RepID=A0A9P5BND4_COLSI|nr:Serine/threonine-protein kinase ppk30 [Colletotrichum siamense]KAF4846093.1 Serine/threonine-protein kinase ppk30 [Colletotrichum siamense]